MLCAFLLGPSASWFPDVSALPFRPTLIRRVLEKDPLRLLTVKKYIKGFQGPTEDHMNLQKALRVCHTADQASRLIHYPASTPPTLGTKGLLSSLFGSTSSAANSLDRQTPSLIAAANIPMMQEALTVTHLFTGSWHEALEATGGLSLLLVLLVHLIEQKVSDEGIALTVDTIVITLNDGLQSPDQQEFRLLLKKVLKSHQAGIFTLKVFLEHSVTRSLLDYDRRGDVFRFCSHRHGIIYNGEWLTFILDCWNLWSTDVDTWSIACHEAMLSSLQALVQDTHVFRDVNVQMLRELDIAHKLAFIMKNGDPGKEECIPIALDVLAALVGSPPDLPTFLKLIQVTLFLHPIEHTYIHHARHSFYFALPVMTSKSSSMTWPRRGQVCKSLAKSASFTYSKADIAQEPLQDTISTPVDYSSDDETPKLDPDRLQNILRSSNKRGGTRKSNSKVLPADEETGLHFGQLCRLESPVSSPDFDELVELELSSTVMEGLLNIINGALLNMPDSFVVTATTSMLLPEYILTLVNHNDPRTRVAATRLLVRYVQRTCRNHSDGYRLDNIQAYQLLACQLGAWELKAVPNAIVEHLAVALLSLMHGVEVTSINGIPELPSRGAHIRAVVLPPLLALLQPLGKTLFCCMISFLKY